jgi:hypothetical protein
VQSIHPGETDIENDQVVDACQSHGQALFAIGSDVHSIPLFLQPFLNEAGDFLLVFHDQDAHRQHPSLNLVGGRRQQRSGIIVRRPALIPILSEDRATP